MRCSFIYHLLFSGLFLFCASHSVGQSSYEVQDAEKVIMSTFIFEGEVVGQQSFLTETGSIHTANEVRIYKLYKGNITSDTLLLLTQGGEVNGVVMEASDLLTLEKGDYGLFFCYPNSIGLRAPGKPEILLDVYSSSQGFYKIDLLAGKAAHPYKQFSLQGNEFEQYLRTRLGLRKPVQLHSLQETSLLKKRNQTRINLLLNDAFGPQRISTTTATMAFSSFSPAVVHAGETNNPAKNVLTITGAGFGSPGGIAALLFDDVNNGVGSTPFTLASTHNLIISWSDSLIKVKVPNRAGTGLVQVRNDLGTVVSSPGELKVFYSILTGTISGHTQQANLMNQNGSGGYTIRPSANLGGGVLAASQRALATWRKLAGLNFTEGAVISKFNVGADGDHVIMLDNAATGNPPLPVGTLGVCYSYFAVCAPASTSAIQKTDFDIVIRNPGFSAGNIAFELGPCAPLTSTIDLETVILHEMGHAANLEHINAPLENAGAGELNPQKLMNYSSNVGVKRNSPDASALQAVRSQAAAAHTQPLGSCGLSAAYMSALPRTVETKDDCPLTFPSEPTFPGTTVQFDHSLASSNDAQDPQFTGFGCNASTGTAITNTLFYPLRTNSAGALELTVSDFINTEPAANCPDTAGAELALYAVSTCPAGQNFPPPIACRRIKGNGALAPIGGLQASATYLLVTDGMYNSKVKYRLAFTGQVLPIKLKHFIGQMNGPVNTLQWSFEAFSEVAKVSLERSTENNQFVSLTSFDNNMMVANRTFVFDDNNPNAGQNLYRLATYNKDGTVEYSQLVFINRNEAIRISIRPNPVKDRTQLILSAANNIGMVTLQIMTPDGKKIYQNPINLLQGQASYPININVPAGTYFVSLINKKGQMLAAETLIKQ